MTSRWRITAGRARGRHNALQDRPRDGTKLRTAYDLFLARPATPIATEDFRIYGGNHGLNEDVIGKLIDYGLDIRHHSHGYWWLVGQTDANGVYHDFIAQRVAS